MGWDLLPSRLECSHHLETLPRRSLPGHRMVAGNEVIFFSVSTMKVARPGWEGRSPPRPDWPPPATLQLPGRALLELSASPSSRPRYRVVEVHALPGHSRRVPANHKNHTHCPSPPVRLWSRMESLKCMLCLASSAERGTSRLTISSSTDTRILQGGIRGGVL